VSGRALLFSMTCSAVMLAAGAGLAARASPVRAAAAQTGDVAYTRVWIDPKLGDRTWITVADLAGDGRRDITERPGRATLWDDYGPVWSPDGSWLAFVRHGRNGSGSGLYVANRDGTQVRRALALPTRALEALEWSGDDFRSTEVPAYAWSPDGQRLAFADGTLWVVDRDGTNSRKLVQSSACKPSWSPDGRTLIYLVDNFCGGRGANQGAPGHRSINLIDVDGSHRRHLATGSFGDASWSPDGRRIAFTN
jgi:Tol biopolymer transport system component